MSTSTAEAETQAVCAAAQFAVWFKRVVADVGVLSVASSPVTILNDNQSAIALASTPAFAARSRHFNLRVHWLKQVVREGIIRVIFVRTDANVADALTKALAKAKLVPFRDEMLTGYQFREDQLYTCLTSLKEFSMSTFNCMCCSETGQTTLFFNIIR